MSGHLRATTLARAIGVTVCLGLLGGCAALSGYPTDPQNSGSLKNSGALDALRDKYFAPGIDDCYRAGNCTAQLNLTDKQAIRNDVVLNRMRVYDMEFSLFARDLSGTNNSITIGSDLTALALNGLGATTGNAATKAALAAASGGVIAANGAVDTDLFYQKTIPALISQMQADRLKAETTLLSGLTKSDADYPLERAELDLDTLNDAGSLNSAVANITQQSATQQSQSQQQMNLYQTSAIATSTSAIAIRTWLKNGGTLDMTRYKQLQAWLTNNSDTSLHTVQVEQLADVTDDSLEAARQRAITEIPIN
jgi:hypothetical protein